MRVRLRVPSFAVVLLAWGCHDRECASAAEEASEALSAGDFATAALVVRAASDCDDVATFAKAREAVEVAEQREMMAAAASKAAKERAAAAARFMPRKAAAVAFVKWVAEHVGAPDRVSHERDCRPQGAMLNGHPDPEAGYCAASARVGDAMHRVDWLDGSPRAFRFSSGTLPGGPEFRCSHVGAKQVRRGRREDGAIVSQCRLRGNIDARLNGLHLWIENARAGGLHLAVFSDEYPGGARHHVTETLETQGETL